jgi:hypothetical protein
MKTARRFTTVVLACLALTATAALTGCSSSSDGAEPQSPVTLKAVPGTDRFEVTLSEQAQERLGLATATAGRDGTRTTIPYAAVIYDSEGGTWVYTPAAAAHTFRRTAITVTSIDGDTAVLGDGPAVGTPVVVVGSPELLGAEAQIAGEQ